MTTLRLQGELPVLFEDLRGRERCPAGFLILVISPSIEMQAERVRGKAAGQ